MNHSKQIGFYADDDVFAFVAMQPKGVKSSIINEAVRAHCIRKETASAYLFQRLKELEDKLADIRGSI